MKKYELTNETIEINDYVLHRIKALVDFVDVKAGDFGGFIEKESNLSHDGYAWVYDNACVYGDARVSGNACILDNAKVFDDAHIFDDAWVYGHAKVCGNANVSGESNIYGNALVNNDVCSMNIE